MYKVVGIGEYAISDNPKVDIVTYALASCVAVTVYCPSKRTAGMVHVALPAPAPNEEGSLRSCYYAVTGVPLMINEMLQKCGCKQEEFIIRLFGGADSIRRDDVFKLGEKNIQMVEKVLKGMNLSYDASETGGLISRTLEMHAATGKIRIKSQPISI